MSEGEITEVLNQLKFDDQGLIPAIVQDAATGRVLTLAYMNREALQLSLKERQTCFWSRSRQKIWHKGETSGNTQTIHGVQADCDGDALLVYVEPQGPACHTGQESCFFNDVLAEEPPGFSAALADGKFLSTIERLVQVIKSRKAEMPEGSYTTYLFSKGLDKILKKIGEESAETIIAAKNQSKPELTLESADLLYHLLVLFVNEGLEIEDVLLELEKRALKKKMVES
ncbi:MAG: bifunctional phosphoribosyl-AMP cyclohydrolase/phosphoribosyl-ATP diphosphatase HisIE [Acidobacteria bacterium]|nr:bifunctional phosphoribosyl-AMP cyclohydrolase/phosphoribosyl-ATP diphosphatase HisIE [Acidobacteriota bacterium]